MKRKLTIAGGALALILASYTAASWQTGSRIQAESELALDAISAQLSKTWGDQIQLSQSGYERGVFSSKVTYVLSFAASKDASVTPEVVFLSRIEHGPFPFAELLKGNFSALTASIRTTLEPTPFTEALFKAAQGQSVLVGRTVIDMNGVSRLDWSAQPIDYTQEKTRSKFGGATLQAEVGPGFSYTRGELKVQSLNVSDGKSSLDIAASRIYADTHMGAFGLNIGTRGASIEQLTIAALDQPTIRADKIQSHMVLNEKSQLLDGEASYAIDALTIDQKNWGKLTAKAVYDKLDSAALKSLLDLNSNLVTRSINNPPEADLVTSSDLKQFWLIVQSLLKERPTLRLDPLTWKTEEGESQFALKAAFAPVNTQPNGLGLTSNPIETLESNLTLSRPMLTGLMAQIFQTAGVSAAQAKTRAEKEIKSLLDVATQVKLGKMNGDAFVSKLVFEKNTFTVNDQKIPAGAVLKLIASAIPSGWLSQEPTPAQDGPDETAEVKHLDPSVLATILTAAGFAFEEARDDQGDPTLKVNPGTSGAAKIDISFIGCGSDPTCEDVLLRATYSPDKPVALKVANDWNLRNRWARAYVNDKQEAVIEMDINAYGGIGRDALEAMVSTFFKIVSDFSKELADAQ